MPSPRKLARSSLSLPAILVYTYCLVTSSMFTHLREVIARVPRGKVITYGQVAEAAGFPGAARQTVWSLQGARGLPWHRVVAAGGRIALPGEQGDRKSTRLNSRHLA